MSRFSLVEETITVRGQPIRIRELTHGERMGFVELSKTDPSGLGAFLVSTCCIDPAITAEEAAGISGAVVDEISSAIMRVCGLGSDAEKKG